MRKIIFTCGFLFLFLLSGISCKKEPVVNYSTITVSISLLEYNFGIYAPGTWSSSTQARIRCAGVVLDSISSLLPAINAPQSVPLHSPCNAGLHILTHAFRVQTNSVNILEFYDPHGIRATYDVYPAAVYFSSTGDSTTLNVSNAGCVFSVFVAR